jgi:hypothetical protein
MAIRPVFICALLLAAAPAIAANAPTDESIQELLTLTNAHQLLDQVKVQMDSQMASAMRDAQQGQALTPERQAILDRMQTKMAAVISQALNWDALQPIYVNTYKASLTQDELDGIISFYQSPAGHAYIKKMPLIMQNVMAEMQGLIKSMQQQLLEIRKETTQELKDLKAQGGS